MGKILFLTRTKPIISSAYYLRVLKLVELFKFSFGWQTELINFYKPVNKVKLTIHTNVEIKKFCRKVDKDIKIIVICGLDPSSIKSLKRYAMKYSIKLYVDVVELASPKEKKFGIFSPSLILNHRIIKKSVTKDMTVLAISHYFEKYYQHKNIPVIYIPNLYSPEIDNTDVSAPKNSKISFGFIGYPHKKDSLDVIMKSMVELFKNNGDVFVFNVVGISKEEFYKKYCFLKKYQSEIEKFTNFVGVVDRGSVKLIYQSINYSVIMRDPKLVVCQSGFPTKFVESFSYGRPVIANLTSDIGSYLHDGFNGFVVDGYSADSLLDVLLKVVHGSASNNDIYKNSYRSASDFFGMQNFSKSLLESYEKVSK